MSPWLVALIRAVVLAAIGAGVLQLSGAPLPGAWAIYTPLLIAVLREAEGLVDQYKKPAQNSDTSRGLE